MASVARGSAPVYTADSTPRFLIRGLTRRHLHRRGNAGDACNVYTLPYSEYLAQGLEFDWDDENTKHLAAHKVTPTEFEYVLASNPVDLGYEWIDNEEDTARSALRARVGSVDGGLCVMVESAP